MFSYGQRDEPIGDRLRRIIIHEYLWPFMGIHVKKESVTLMLALVGILCLTGCRKTCTCVKNNGTSHTFTAEEVKAQNGDCQSMKYMYSDGSYDPTVSYYSVCNWD